MCRTHIGIFDMTLKTLYDTFNKLRSSVLHVKSEKEREENEKKQEEVSRKIEKWHAEHPNDSPYHHVPHLSSSQFNQSLANNTKFSVWNHSPDMVHAKDRFVRTDSQNFVRTFIHPNTPYQSIVLWHGTGVGKTCSAIGIAEQYTKQLFSENKKVWIICPKALISTWYSEIFNVFKEVASGSTSLSSQCTGDRYTSVFKTLMKEFDGDVPKVEKRMMSHIQKYYRIMNYDKFVQVVENIRNEDNSPSEGEMIRELKKEFNRSMIIVDEAHNLRKKGGKTTTRSVNALRSIRSIKVPKGTVISIADRRALGPRTISKEIRRNSTLIQLGDKDKGGLRIDRISGEGSIILYEKPKYKGRSVVVSSSVNTFTTMKVTKTISDMLQYVTRHSDQMKLVLLTATPLYDSHEEIIDLINLCRLNDKRPTQTRRQVFPLSVPLSSETHPLYSFTRGYISYVRGSDPKTFPMVVYPNKKYTKPIGDIRVYMSSLTDKQSELLEQKRDIKVSDIDPSKKMISTLLLPNGGYDNDAFYALFSSRSNAPPFRQPDGMKLFSKKHLADFSPKYANVLREIETCQGVVFVYTEYLITGAFTFAMMLEENGFKRYSSSSYPRPSMLQNPSSDRRRRKKLGSYVIFDQSNPGEIAQLLETINSPQNSRGQKVRVIIGTRRIEQGVTFKHVRQIHILTPWWNMNRNKQIIGRGSRTLSHAHLPLSERNVTVFYHAGISKNGYSPDFETYGTAQEKQKLIHEVENVLRRNSIDCLTYAQNNQYVRENVVIVDSHGKRRSLTKDDIVTEEVEYTCVRPPTKYNPRRTFSMSSEIKPKVKQFYRLIRNGLFPAKRRVLSSQAMTKRLSKICQERRMDVRIIPFVLQYMIKESLPIYADDLEGILSFQEKYYLFQPIWTTTGEERRYLPMVYRNIIPQKHVLQSKALQGLETVIVKQINERVAGVIEAMKKVPEYIVSQYGEDVYNEKQLQSFINHRRMMLIDEMDTSDRLEFFNQWRNSTLSKEIDGIVSDYFGTSRKPSLVDESVGKIKLKNTTYFRILNGDGKIDIYTRDEKTPLSNRESQVIRVHFPMIHTMKLSETNSKYIGFRTYARRGTQTVFKIVSNDSYSKFKNRKSGCACTASGLGRKPVVVQLLNRLKTLYTGKRSTKSYDKIYQSSKNPLKRRTVCEELELLFRSIDHEDVTFGSLRQYHSS